MSTQSLLDQIRAARIGRGNLTILVAGIIVGLVLGLLIGWVWWPVEWKGTAFNDLSTETKAAYMGAVADAYAARSSPEAAALAMERLAPLPGDLSKNFDDVIAYTAEQANSGVRVGNLVALAAAVGVPIAVQENPAIAGTGQPVTPGGAVASGAAAPAAPGGQGGGLSGWFAVVLLALLLIGGGLYILWRIAQQRELNEEVAGSAFTDEPAPPGAAAAASFERDSLTPVARTSTPSYTENSATGSGSAPAPRPQSVTSPFDADDDDELPTPGAAPVPPGYVRSDTWRGNVYDPIAPMAAEVDAGDVDEDLEEEEPEEMVDEEPASTPPEPASAQPAVNEGQSMLPAPVSGSPALARSERYITLDSYTATYQVGMTDFDFTRNVPNPDGVGYVGEYGIGISERHGLLNNNMEQVVALEVYLFDKTEEAQMTTVTRALLSEYAHDKLYKFFEREKQGTDPLTAQPNTQFQLDGKQLVLTCLVKDVRYTREGAFQMVTVEMVLKRKS